MERNGFTLIELMAVITILVILSLIIVPIVDKNVKRSKEEMYSIQIENIRMSGMGYFSDNIGKRPRDNMYCSIPVSLLVSEGYMSGDVVNPKNGQDLSDLFIQIFNKDGRYSYLVCPVDSDCQDTSTICS